MTYIEFAGLQPGAVIRWATTETYWVVVRASVAANHNVLLEFLYNGGPQPWPPYGRFWTLYSDDPHLAHGELL